MATLGSAYVTLADVAKQKDPDGSMATIAEVLMQENAMMGHIPWVPTNKDTSHVMTLRSGIPQPSLRRLNEGIAPTKTTNAQVEDTLAMLEDRSVLDIDMPTGGNLAQLRLNEAKGHMEGFAQYAQYLMIYGATNVDERQFNGLAIRYNAITGNVADNVINAGGTGTDNTSVWLINWGPEKVFGLYPKDSAAGLMHEDKGQEFQPTSVTAGAVGSGYYGWVDRYGWKFGLGVKDWRNVVRIANVDISDLTTGALGTGTQASTAATYLVDLMADAIERLPPGSGGNPQFYCTRRVRTWVRRQSAVKATYQIDFDKPAGTTSIPIMRVHGVPVNICDQILETEDDVPATLAEFP